MLRARALLPVVWLVATEAGCEPKPARTTNAPPSAEAPTTSSATSPAYTVGELPPPEATPPSDQALARVEAHRQREIQPFVTSPAFAERGDQCMAALPDEDPANVGQALAIELVSLGLPLLSDEDLLRWTEVRRAIASTSRPACALVWVSGLEPPQLDMALASIDDAMASDYFRLRIRAATTALANPSAPPTTATPERVREVVARVLGAEAWNRTAALLDQAELSVDEACYLEESVFGALASTEPQTRVDLVRELFAATAAVPSALPRACLGST